MNADIACHSGFCVFQPVRKKHSTISANKLNALTRTAGRVVTKARFAVKTASRNFATASFARV